MRVRVSGSLFGAVLTTGALLVAMTGSASAVEAKPFAITKFTMQTTGPTKVVPLGEQRGLGPEYEIVNEPAVFTQAGGHPWALTTTLEFASEEFESAFHSPRRAPTRDPRDTVVSLPPGLLGDPVAVPRCPLASLTQAGRCPASTQVGEYRIRWHGGNELLAPIVNVTPEAGQSAEFALETPIKLEPILTAHLVRTPQGYGFTVASNRIPEVEFYQIELTFWGVPADPSHDALRGIFCQYAAQTPFVQGGPLRSAAERRSAVAR